MQQKLKNFWRQENGTASVDAVIWIPIFFFLTFAIMDAFILFNRYTMTLRTVQDINRKVSLGWIRADDSTEVAAAETSVETWVANQINHYAPNATVQSVVPHPGSTDFRTYTAVSIPVDDMVATSWFKPFLNFNMTITSSHYVEF